MIGIIGGSGVLDLERLSGAEEREVDTPFGKPSAPIVTGKLDGVPVAFLLRHGVGHSIPPSSVNYRANIYALKALGAKVVIGLNAVGGMKEERAPRTLVIPDQLIDRTTRRQTSFFTEAGLVAHISFAEPFCPRVRTLLTEEAARLSLPCAGSGTYICMEGPQFSTRAESEVYRSFGVDVIGMTAAPEAKLAREAEMCYATICFVTDYDCWRVSEEPVSLEQIIANLREGAKRAKRLLRAATPKLAAISDCGCRHALDGAIATNPRVITRETRERLSLLLRGRP